MRATGASPDRARARLLARPRVDALLASAWERRVTLVIAGGGHGKTTALRALADTRPVRWLGLGQADRGIEGLVARLAQTLELEDVPGLAVPTAPIGAEDRRGLAEGQAAVLCESLVRRGGETLLVLDDIDQLTDADAGVHLLRALCLQAPALLHIALSGRLLPSLGLGAAAGSGELLEIAAPDLAFTLPETAQLIAARLGESTDAIARQCWELTGGWAAALNLIIDRLERLDAAEWQPTLNRLPLISSELWREFVGELLEQESSESRRTIEVAAIAPMVDSGLLGALGVAHPRSELEGLQRRGLLVAPGGQDRCTMSPVLSAVVCEQLPPADADALRDRVAGWLESVDRLEEALECRRAGPAQEARAFLERRGHALVGRGQGAGVAEILGQIGSAEVPALDGILAEALQAVGDWDGAIETFGRVRRACDGGRLAPALAWRYGALLYLRGDSGTALEVLSAAHVESAESSDDALVSAWLSSTQWSRGEPGEAAQTAAIALRQAERGRDSAALAAAHVAAALAAASIGDRERNERHYRAALKYATQAGDSVQLARIRANLSSRALEEGDYALAIEESDRALSVGAGHKFFAALAMCNKAEALLRIGELDDARATLADSLETYEALGSLLACAPQSLLGMVYRERGDLTRARVSFERSLRLAEHAGDAHTSVFALCGLAPTVAEDDPLTARTYASQAIERASSLERAQALCAAASVELVAGDRPAAVALAGDAELEARRTGDRASLAEALSLRGMAAEPPSEERLGAALELWDELGSVIAQLRTRLQLVTLRGDEAAADELRRELSTRGVSPGLGPAARADRGELPAPDLIISTLGRFAVVRGGEHLGAGAWQSRKARDLLKLLAGRLGRPVTRETAAEALWQNESPGPLSNRLSVALSTLRRVLDPHRAYPPDQLITSDGQSMALRLDRAKLDVAVFLETATRAIATAAEGRLAEAEADLREAEKLYIGDFLEEDLYEDWTVDCREAARSAAVEVSRLLARAASERGDEETASRHLRRLLERDPYDEDAWIALVGAQSRLRRYGEARRQHALYARRMAELEVAPVTLVQAAEVRP